LAAGRDPLLWSAVTGLTRPVLPPNREIGFFRKLTGDCRVEAGRSRVPDSAADRHRHFVCRNCRSCRIC